ncbi:MAG TPA: transglutaminase domain-containing protein [Gemmataceae bacterium]|nr:transglutaminase domain-containing protein [Gemmataceae bacterium]
MRSYVKPLILLYVLVLVGWPLVASSEEPAKTDLDPNLPYHARRSNPVTYDVDFAVAITAPYHAKKLKVWLALPQTDTVQEVEEGGITTFPMKVSPKISSEKTFGNQFAYFEFDHPEGGQLIRHKFKIKVWELFWDIDPAKVVQVARWPAGFDRYLKSDKTVRVDDRFQLLAKEIVPEQKNPADDLAAVMDWLDQHMTYDHSQASLRASSEHALTKKTGHCSDYHGLCAAFGRALGFPTRITYGINTFAKNSPSHCKIEAYLPPYGWVSFDVSETQNLVNNIKKAKSLSEQEKTNLVRAATQRLRRGFRDNTWYLQTRGTDYELSPPASTRVPVVRTLYAEADGVALPDPDPANPRKHEFAWMTLHQFTPDRAVSYPFKEWNSLVDSKDAR